MTDRITRYRYWIKAGLIAVAILLALALAVAKVQQLRESARRVQSRNNLRHILLALSNYHDNWGSLPAGGTLDARGHALHGWPTMLMPFVESSPLYGWIDFRQPWNAPFNASFFREHNYWFLNPSIYEEKPPRSFGSSHYSANSNLMGANSWVSIAGDATLAQTFLVGELGGDFVPWGCPYNWCPLLGFENQPRTYGRGPQFGGQFGFVDGSVRWIAGNTAPNVLETLRGPDLASAAAAGLAIQRPAEFPYPRDAWELVWFPIELNCYLHGMRDGEGEMRHLYLGGGKSSLVLNDQHLLRLKEFPKLTKLYAEGEFTDHAAESLASLTELQELSLSSRGISDEACSFLKQMPHLETLSIDRERLTDAFVAYLRGLPELRSVRLEIAEVTDDVPALLESLSHVEEIQLVK